MPFQAQQRRSFLAGLILLWAACVSVSAGQDPTDLPKTAVTTRPAAPRMAEFYLVMRECSTTAASLLSDQQLATTDKRLERPDISRCTRKKELVSCNLQVEVDKRLIDHPAHGPDNYTVDEDTVPPDNTPLWRLSNAAGTHDWITLNTFSRTAITVGFVNGLDSVRSIVCRGMLATASELEKVRSSN